ncbi:MAG: hypothetical protein RJA63_335 [Pseudomonadota bacterium]
MQMDTRRVILLVVFAVSMMMLWNNWAIHNAPKKAAALATQSASAEATGIPQPMASSPESTANAVAPAEIKAANYDAAAKAIVKTDNLIAVVSAQGGDIIRVELTKHKATGDLSKNYQLLQDAGDHIYVANSGLIGEGLPNHKTVYALQPGEYSLKDGEDKLELRMAAPVVNGVAVTKVLTFHRDSYLVDVRHEINNATDNPIKTTAYFQIARDDKPVEHSTGIFGGVTTFTGPAVYTEAGKFQKVEFSEIAEGKGKYVKEAKDGWIAMVQHYFVSAYLPKGDSPREFYARKISDGFFGFGVKMPVSVEAGKSASIEVPLYAGPQEQSKLKALAPGFDLVVDYGWVTIIAVPVFWLLSTIHTFVGNWGWAIILVTLVIKLAFFPLSAASYRSMAKMKTLMPRMKQIQERNANDKMKQNQEMMELYKREKVNPMGGCLPMVIQIPVFIALYWVLLGVVEMRQAPWLGWITDLSVKDPYYILPLIMGASMLIQTKLNPSSPDPVQAKVMMAMPVVFTAMFLFFPSGLVLYWVVNNVLSIAQQWYITRMIEAGGKAANDA